MMRHRLKYVIANSWRSVPDVTVIAAMQKAAPKGVRIVIADSEDMAIWFYDRLRLSIGINVPFHRALLFSGAFTQQEIDMSLHDPWVGTFPHEVNEARLSLELLTTPLNESKRKHALSQVDVRTLATLPLPFNVSTLRNLPNTHMVWDMAGGIAHDLITDMSYNRYTTELYSKVQAQIGDHRAA